MAQQSSRSSVELFTSIFFKDKVVTEEGRVIRVMKNGFIVLIPKYGLEGIVRGCVTDNDPKPTKRARELSEFVYDEAENKLVHVENKATIRLFDTVNVQISIVESQLCIQLVL